MLRNRILFGRHRASGPQGRAHRGRRKTAYSSEQLEEGNQMLPCKRHRRVPNT